MSNLENLSSETSRCYAAHLGGCGGGISLEHISSKRIFKDAKMVETLGMGAPAGKRISLNSVGANICSDHNSQLSPLDDAIGELADALGEFWRSGGAQSILVNGTLVERWMLKYIFGASAAGYVGGQKMYPDENAVRQLFGLDPMMDAFALYGVALPSVHRIYNTSVSMRAIAQFGREVDLAFFRLMRFR